MKDTPKFQEKKAVFHELCACLAPLCLLMVCACAQSRATAADPGAAPAAGEAPLMRDDWPRQIQAGALTFSVSQPQVESWAGNRLTARAAVGAQKQGEKQRYGTIWFTARTEVNKYTRMVLLQDFAITKILFQGIPDQGQGYRSALESALPGHPVRIALDRLAASLEITDAPKKVKPVQVSNQPPRVIFEVRPSVLVLVDGKPALRDIPGSPLKQVINTGVLLAAGASGSPWYLWLSDRWVQAPSLEGPWSAAAAAAQDALAAARQYAASAKKADLLETVGPEIRQALQQGRIPAIYVSTTPARLVQTRGEPDFEDLPGTSLRYAKNSNAIIIFDRIGLRFYILIDGRWYRSDSLQGPWAFVDGKSLPPDFARIPPGSPAGRCLYAVPGTPQARQAVVEATTPHTQTIERSATAKASYDGQPRFEPVAGTPLFYSVNSSPPVIRVDEKTYFLVQNGVWFCATSPLGPWAVAAMVPQVIYTVPAGSPVHYVTYVHVYGTTPTAVYTGYTSGYNGVYVSPTGTVVYSTGFMYPGWAGACWYPPPNYYYYHDDSFEIHETHDGRFIDRGYNDYGTYTKVGDTTFARTDDGHYAAHDGNLYKRELGGWKQYDPDSGDWELSNFSKAVDAKRIKDIREGDSRIQQHREEKGKNVIFGPGSSANGAPAAPRELEDSYRARAEGERRASEARSGGGFRSGGFGGGGFGRFGGFRGGRR